MMKQILTFFVAMILLATTTIVKGQKQNAKVSKHLMELATKHNSKSCKQTSDEISECQAIDVLATLSVQCDAQAFFKRHGCRVIDSIGRIYIVSIPIEQVAPLAKNDTVQRLEAERMPKPAMDVTPQYVNAVEVYNGTNLPQAYTGAGVAAGVFDCYFDFTHPAFLDSNGNLRIQYYYDFHWVNADGTRGRAIETPSEIAALQHSQNTRNGIHGTHVAGIMAGSPVEGQMQGMAPEADIYLADFNSDAEQFDNPDANTSATAVLGFKYIFDRAEADGKPCVINFSSCESILLTHQRELESEALNALTGPGRIIVVAAGNDGERSCYLEKSSTNPHAGTGIKGGIHGGGIIDIELVSQRNQQVRFDFLGMFADNIEGSISFNTDNIRPEGNHYTTTTSQGEIALDVSINPYQDPRGTVYSIHGTMPNIYYLTLGGATVLLSGDSPAYMYSDIAYSPFVNVEGVAEYSFAQPGYSVTWPATLPGMISVGATGYKSTVTNINGQTDRTYEQFAPAQLGQRATFSALGPTFYGNIKPDVMAPGLNIEAAYCSFFNDQPSVQNLLTRQVNYNGETYYYLSESGTSMAAPVVAGAIALWLQAKPDLTPQQVLEIISRTATHPVDTMTYPNNTYGYGQIDVYAGLLEVLDLPVAIPELSKEQPQGVNFRIVNKQLYADFGNDIPNRILFNIYSLDGRLLLSCNGQNPVNLSALKNGVYAVQLITDSKYTSGSTLIRLF